MTSLKAFNYANITQRRGLMVNAFIAATLVSCILIDIFHSVQYYLFYIDLKQFIFLAIFPGFVLGSLLGRFTFRTFQSSKALCIITDLLFFGVCAVYIGRFFIVEGNAPFLTALILWKHSILLFSGILTFFLGIKVNYFLKVSSGDFIDEKHGIAAFVISQILGIFAGVVISSIQLSGIISADNIILISSLGVLALFIPVSSFFINMPYNPDTRYTQHFGDEDESVSFLSVHRDDVFFTYLNVSYIFMYIYLGYISYIKFFGGFYRHSVIYITCAALLIMAGFVLGRMIKQAFWHIYSEMLFPVFFLLYIFLLNRFHGSLSAFTALVFLIPAGILFGFTIYQTVKMVIDRFEQEKRYDVLFFSIFLIPAPILIILSFIEFTYFLFFLTVYVIALLNIIFPGMYLLSRNAKNYQKRLFFGMSLIFIPILLFLHLYLKIPMNSSLYISRITNFETLKNTNYDALYIKNKADVMINDIIAFDLSHSVIRNMKRAVVPLFIYHPIDKSVLIIDGNQKFFRQSVFAWFKDFDIINTLPKRFVNYENLPLTGKELYVADDKTVIDILSNEKKYYSILDFPNLLDLQFNRFRFTEAYYSGIKQKLVEGGIFAEIVNLNYCSDRMFTQSVHNLKALYKYQVVYRFADIVLILASDNESAFKIDENISGKVSSAFSEIKDMSLFFYSDAHLFSNLLFNDVSALLPFINTGSITAPVLNTEKSNERNNLDTFYAETNNAVFKTTAIKNYYTYAAFERAITQDKKVLSLLKESDMAEADERYTDEMEALFAVKNLSNYTISLQAYIKTILSNKEEYYYNAAMYFETKKDWETARKMYQAVLAIDKDNFEANYRLGILSLTVQDMDSSFKYLQYALTLRKDDPKALAQMGILLFSTGRSSEAIQYFNQALDKRERSAQIYFYMGLSYEEMGRFAEAKSYFERAIIEDPNDKTITIRLENLNVKIQEERNKWNYTSPKNEYDSEKGESIPLPIDKGSYDQRLDDDSAVSETDKAQ